MQKKHLLPLFGLLFYLGFQEETNAIYVDEPEQPNIVFFYADDLGWGDLGSFGHPTIRTPHIDRLASQGQMWTQFYIAEPICSPSRGAFLTGRLPVRSGLYGRKLPVLFEGDPNSFPAEETTIGEILKSAGYKTALIGKWHLGDTPESFPTRHGFDTWFGIPYSNDMPMAFGPSRDEIIDGIVDKKTEFMAVVKENLISAYMDPKESDWNVPLLKSEISDTDPVDTLIEHPLKQDELTEKFTSEAVQYIENHQEGPFFLYLSYAKPHVPLFPGKNFQGKSEAGRYGDAVEEIDWSVGEVMKALASRGFDNNTLVIFTSDNGPSLKMKHHAGSAGPLRDGKGSPYEGGFRVPAIFWWPDKISPKKITDIGSTLDLLPTLTAVGVASLPEMDLDGYDLTPTLLGEEGSPRTTIPYFIAGKFWGYRSGAYKLQLLAREEEDPDRLGEIVELNPPRLYNLNFDPGEKVDMAPENRKLVKKMQKEIKKFLKKLPIAEPLFDRRLN